MRRIGDAVSNPLTVRHMWIVRLALRRPYTFVVLSLILILTTPLLLRRTPTDIFPSIDIPVISVIWQYPGLNAQEIEQRIIYTHERSLSATVNDVEHVESNSYNGVGIIKVFLQPGASVDAGVAQITAVAQTILKQMPQGQTPPLVIRYNASTVPILQYSLTSKTLSEQEIYDLAQNQFRVGLATVHGAQLPWPYGGKTRVISVDLNLNQLKAKNLSPQDVVEAVSGQNLVLPGGTAKIGETEYNVELNGSPKVLESLNTLPLKVVNKSTILLSDVAQVRDGFQPQQNIVRKDGGRGVLVTVMKSGSSSTMEVVSGVKAELPKVIAGLPKEIEVKEFVDESVFVKAAVDGVVHEGVIAAVLTAIMILLFIGSWRSTVIIALSIPLAVLSSLAILSALGETINLMTLGGLSLAVGILVDDATVEIENVHRQMAMGKPLTRAILDGAQEIAGPAFVSTLCICIVFVPMFFLTGVAKFLFVPLAEAVVFAMLASYVLSRTLIPTLVMWFYRNSPYHGHEEGMEGPPVRGWKRPFVAVQRGFEHGFERFKSFYQSLLGAFLRLQWRFALLFISLCAASLVLVPMLGQDFFPNVDTGQFRLHLRARTGTRIEETARLVDAVEQVIRREIPQSEVAGILDNIGIPNSGISLSYSNNGLIGTGDADILVSLTHDHKPTDEYVRKLRVTLNKEFPGTTFYTLPADIVTQTLNMGLPAPLDIQIYGRDQAGNRIIAAKLADKIRGVPGAVDVRVQQPADQPKLLVNVDRDKAAELGLNEKDVANSVLLSLTGSGQVSPLYWLNPKNGVQYLLNVRVPDFTMDSITALEGLPVGKTGATTGDSGQLLTNMASFQRAQGPAVVSHYNVMPVVDVFGNVSGRDLGGVLSEVMPLVEEAKKDLPRGSFILVKGQAQTMETSFTGLAAGLVVAIILIYLLLVINFQSWLDPFIIITALPAALAGVAWGLYVTNTTLSVPALMGAIMSLGVATANSVLVVSFARERLREGMSSAAAAMAAGSTRLRAVIMTALAMMIGMVPMSLSLGEGGEQNAPLARAVIGGLLLATIATLFFVPTVFSILHRNTKITEPMEDDDLLSDSPSPKPSPSRSPEPEHISA